MSSHRYLGKFDLWAAAGQKRDESSLLRLLEDLNLPELEDFLRDIILNDPSPYSILGVPKGEELLPYSITYLTRLGRTPRQSVSRALERLISSGISTENDSLTSGVLLIASSILEEPLLSFLVNLIHNEQVRDDIRVEIASALSSHPEAVPPTFWTRIDLIRYPRLAPMCIASIGSISPDVALKMLDKVIVTKENTHKFEYPLRLTLRSLLRKRSGIREFSRVWARSSPSTRRLLQTVSAFSEFDLFRHGITRITGLSERDLSYLSLIVDGDNIEDDVRAMTEGTTP